MIYKGVLTSKDDMSDNLKRLARIANVDEESDIETIIKAACKEIRRLRRALNKETKKLIRANDIINKALDCIDWCNGDIMNDDPRCPGHEGVAETQTQLANFGLSEELKKPLLERMYPNLHKRENNYE